MPITFKEEPDTRGHGLTNRLVSECGKVEIGVYRVMYGFRVRAGYTESDECAIDWCAGANWLDVQTLFCLAVRILSHRDASEDCFRGIPASSQIKPFYRDIQFVTQLSQLMEETTK